VAERFNWLEGEGRLRKNPAVRRVRYGEGYSARIESGINTNLALWDITVPDCDPTVADEIEDFFDARGAVESFLWQTPRGVDISVVCAAFDRQYTEDGRSCVLQMTFEQVVR
jgi:phage-related protein